MELRVEDLEHQPWQSLVWAHSVVGDGVLHSEGDPARDRESVVPREPFVANTIWQRLGTCGGVTTSVTDSSHELVGDSIRVLAHAFY